jgi:integral membrane protein (TIGR01906 family)
VSDRAARAAGSVVVAGATAVLIIALAIVPFLNSAWVGFGQERAEAAAWTGYSSVELRAATDAILADLVVGPPDFDVEIAGEPVLGPRERQHMADVRGVFAGMAVLAAVAAAVLLAAAVASRRSRSFWRALRAGAVALAAAIAVVGMIGLLAFETAFEVFHRLFFAGGSYTFDPLTDRLVQLFPQRFWFETTLAVGALILVLCAVTAWLAGRRLRTDAYEAAVPRARLEAAR